MEIKSILCINLKRATERRSYIEKEWIEKRGCNVTFLEAFDRRELDNGKRLFDYDENAALKEINRKLTHGEVACITSHILAVKYVISNNIQDVVIIEDDAIPLFEKSYDLHNSLSQIGVEYPNAEISILHATHNGVTCNDHYGLASEPPWGNCAVYFKQSVYEEFVNDLSTFTRPADWYWHKYIEQGRVVIPVTPLIQHHGVTTYIGNDYRGKLGYRNYIS